MSRQTISDSGYTMDEIITIASLIEKETDGDGTKISSVIRNRLKNSGETAAICRSMRHCSTRWASTKRLTDADKEIDSPYNLYKNKGLPPTPIPNWHVLDPLGLYPDNSYYFYALGEDGVHTSSRRTASI
ncbi:MAG: endolytic transglycosylase MltG [Ruthenibacterium lactatiformans]|uniref:endolytic transglycosylase MltG n=1 Tax=Ruthenibacterium lactatiformans TaxID=1550024 RepID=UPI003991C292